MAGISRLSQIIQDQSWEMDEINTFNLPLHEKGYMLRNAPEKITHWLSGSCHQS